MAGKRSFSPDDRNPPHLLTRRERLVRMAPPANDNRGQGVTLGRLRFTGLRLVVVLLVISGAVLMAVGAGLI